MRLLIKKLLISAIEVAYYVNILQQYFPVSADHIAFSSCILLCILWFLDGLPISVNLLLFTDKSQLTELHL